MSGRLFYWVANWNLSRAQAQRLLGGAAVTADMFDCTSSAWDRCKHAIPTIRRLGAYITGSSDIRWTLEQLDQARAMGAVVELIDQSNLDLPLLSDIKLAKDVESGASLISEAVTVARQRLHAGDDYTVYVDQAELPALEHAIAVAGLPHGEIVAYQWASPTSDPNVILPGTSYTLKESNADLSVVRTDWLPLPGPRHPEPPHKGPAGTFAARVEVTERGVWDAHGVPSPGAVLGGPDEWWEVKVGVNRARGIWRTSPLPAERV